MAQPQVPRTQRNVPMDTRPQVPAPEAPPTTEDSLIHRSDPSKPQSSTAAPDPPGKAPRLSRPRPGAHAPGFVVITSGSGSGAGSAPAVHRPRGGGCLPAPPLLRCSAPPEAHSHGAITVLMGACGSPSALQALAVVVARRLHRPLSLQLAWIQSSRSG